MRTLLRALVDARHLRDHTLFTRAYDKAAADIDRSLIGTGPSPEQLTRWLNGKVKTRPRAHHCLVLERMFPGKTITDLLGPADPPDHPHGGVHTRPQRSGRYEEDTTNRRQFVLGSTTAAGLLVAALLDEPDRMTAALDTSSITPDRLAMLEQTAERLSVRVREEAPGTLTPSAITAFRTVRGLVGEPQRTADRVALIRTASKLAFVMGQILFDEGELHSATQWYTTAHSAARDIGDPYLADLALGGSCYVPTYFGDPRDVLRAVGPRLDQRSANTPALAWLWAFKAKAHASLREELAFRHAINRSREILDASPAELNGPGVFAFRQGKLAFYEATGYVRLRNTTRAIQAADRALALYTDENAIGNMDPALISLDKASALVHAGDLGEGCRVASAAVLDERTYASASVARRAREFDGLLGSASTPDAHDWRDALRSVTAHRPAALTT